MRIVGCVEGREITLTRAGAHPLAHALIRKSLQTEPDMDVAIAKAIAGFNEETRAHFLTLSDTDMTAFVAKSAADQAADVEKAKKTPPYVKPGDEPDADDMKKSIAEIVRAAMAPVTEQLAELKKSNEQLAAKDLERTRDVEIERRASTEFAAYPGGAVAAVKMLKSIAGLADDERADIEKMMTARIELARRGGMTVALTEDELSRAAPATTELSRKAKELAKSKNIPESEALAQIGQDPAFGDLVLQAEAESMAAN